MAREARTRTAGVLALALAVVAGCSGSGGSRGSGEDPSPAASASASTSGADARADLTILPEDALPKDWRRVDPADRIDGNPGKPRYCGVDAEPEGVVEGRVPYYESSRLPSAILEYGMVATEASATATLDALEARRDDCVDPGYEVTAVPAAELADVGDQRVAWDLVAEDDPTLRSRALVFRRGEVVVVLVATGQTSVPTAEQQQVAEAIDRRLRG
jgi:hypothetical protein